MAGIPPNSLVLRPLVDEDLTDVVALAKREGRNVTSEEYARFVELEGARGFVVTREGALMGAATAMRYFEHGFLGPILLRHDAEDATGIAIALLAQIIESLQREGVSILDAEAGVVEETILARMGFQAVRRTTIMERPETAIEPAHASIAMEDHHLLDIGALDAEGVGFGRKEYLAALRRDAPEGARVVERDGEVAGFALVRAATRGYHLGPLVTRGRDAATARALVRDAVAAAKGARVVALVPDDASVKLLSEEGFREVGALSRMRAGGAEHPARPEAATEWVLGGRLTG